jgi:hypothetical protein
MGELFVCSKGSAISQMEVEEAGVLLEKFKYFGGKK